MRKEKKSLTSLSLCVLCVEVYNSFRKFSVGSSQYTLQINPAIIIIIQRVMALVALVC